MMDRKIREFLHNRIKELKAALNSRGLIVTGPLVFGKKEVEERIRNEEDFRVEQSRTISTW